MADSLINRLIKTSGISILKLFDTLVGVFANNRPVLNEKEIPFCKILKDNHKVILEEYKATKEKRLHNVKDFYKTETDLNYDDNWKAVPIILFGYVFRENAQLYPETYRLVNNIPGCCGAMFSVLGAGKHVPPHKGIYKGVYRCLFTLQVEKGENCWIRIDSQKVLFAEGESVVFDETFDHEVMNASSQPRIVLYLDLYRKLPFPINLMNGLLFFLLQRSPFVQTILNEYQKLENTSIERIRSIKSSGL